MSIIQVALYSALSLITLALPLITTQVSVSGQWRSENAGIVIVLNLQTQGRTVTGTVREGSGASSAIFEGNVSGYALSFTTDAQLNGTPVTVIWTGNLEDDGFTMTRVMQLPDGSIRKLLGVFKFLRN